MQFLATDKQKFAVTGRDFNRSYTCSIGRGGMIAAGDKREGDGASPIGIWPMKQVFYRADRLAMPQTGLPCTEITQTMGWCDAPDDPDYNRLVRLPYPASHETMWREDHVYDVVVELGHNDSPPRPGYGSAIFLHVAKPGYTPTQGCIALALDDLLDVLKYCDTNSALTIST